jgi:molybdate transport system substrate-binding protein
VVGLLIALCAGLWRASPLKEITTSGNGMTCPLFQRRLFAAFMAIAASGLAPTPSAAADVRVFSSGAPAEIAQGLARAFTEATGHRLLITSGTVGSLQQRLLGSESADVVVLPMPTIETLEKAHKLQAASRVSLARVGIGVAVRQDAPLPDVSTVDALRRALLAARSIAHPDPRGGGFTGAHIGRMIERMGIAEAVKPKVKLMFAIGGGVAAVAKGEVEIGLFNISEILPVPGAVLAGALPAELQSYITFAGALHVDSAAPDAAAAYLKMLASAREAWRAGGFEPFDAAR